MTASPRVLSPIRQRRLLFPIQTRERLARALAMTAILRDHLIMLNAKRKDV
jgi:hypothetical protein